MALPACGDDKPTPGDTTDDATPTDTADDAAVEDTTGDTTPEDTTADTTPEDTATDTAPDAPPSWAALVVNEIAPAGDPTDWVEFHNPTAAAVSLDGWYFTDSDPTHIYPFPAGSTLAPGAWLVVAEGVDGFDFGIGAADAVRLFAPDDTLIDSAEWTAESLPRAANYGRLPDGSGPFTALFIPTRGAANVENPETFCGNSDIEALEVCDTANFGTDSCTARGWGGGTLSCEDNCTRIDAAGCTARAAGVVINEVTSAGDDNIELFNGTEAAVDLGGWMLMDDGGGSYLIAPNTTLEAGAYMVFVKDVHHTFGLGGSDAVILLNAEGSEVDRIAWATGQAAVSYCRRPNGTGGFAPCPSASFGGENF
jgi:hypothetical protein